MRQVTFAVGLTVLCWWAMSVHAATLKCPPDSVLVGDACIDLYEVSVWRIPPCAPGPKARCQSLVNKVQQGTATLADLTINGATQLAPASTCRGPSDYGANFPDTGNWTPEAGPSTPSPRVYALSIPGVQPSACITWFQANQACRLSGKRLARNDEWLAAAQGTPDPGTDNGTTDCNVGTGTGNVQEWTADWTEANVGGCTDSTSAFGFPGSDDICFRGYVLEPNLPFPVPGPLVRGGEFQDGPGAGVFAVDTSLFPADSDYGTGFRCARSAQ